MGDTIETTGVDDPGRPLCGVRARRVLRTRWDGRRRSRSNQRRSGITGPSRPYRSGANVGGTGSIGVCRSIPVVHVSTTRRRRQEYSFCRVRAVPNGCIVLLGGLPPCWHRSRYLRGPHPSNPQESETSSVVFAQATFHGVTRGGKLMRGRMRCVRGPGSFNRFARRVAGLATAVLVAASALALPMRAVADARDVSLGGVWIGHIDQDSQGISAADRATAVTRRLTELVSDPTLRGGAVTVTVRPAGNDAVISVASHLIITITQADAAAVSVPPVVMAEQWGARLAQGLIRALAVSAVRLDTPDGVTTVSRTNASGSSNPSQSGSVTAPASSSAPGSTAPATPPAGSSSAPAATPAPTPPTPNSPATGQGAPAPSGQPAPGQSPSAQPAPAQQQRPAAPATPSTAQQTPAAPGTPSPAAAPSLGVSDVQLVPTSDTHVAPGGRVTFALSFKVQGNVDAVDVTVGWQGQGQEPTYAKFVRVTPTQGDNTLNNVWFNIAKDATPFYIFRVYAVVKVGDTVLRSSPVMVIVRQPN